MDLPGIQKCEKLTVCHKDIREGKILYNYSGITHRERLEYEHNITNFR